MSFLLASYLEFTRFAIHDKGDQSDNSIKEKLIVSIVRRKFFAWSTWHLLECGYCGMLAFQVPEIGMATFAGSCCWNGVFVKVIEP